LLDFSTFEVGTEYDRSSISQFLGYASEEAIMRGVVTPRGENHIILFVTKHKSVHQTQYEDKIDQDVLFWEGPEGHGSEKRMVEKKDTIHLFYRDQDRSRFTYEGRVALLGQFLNTDRPSKFTFRLVDRARVTEQSIVEDIKIAYGLSETEKEAIIKSRRGQGIYRVNALRLWNTCSVTGFTKANVLVASHIKPWKFSANAERVDHFNSLILVPSLDKLFDKGYISFDLNGKISISDNIHQPDLERIGVSARMRLRDVPEETKTYLAYHQEYRFNILKV
jgi:putative restriction endonuclease